MRNTDDACSRRAMLASVIVVGGASLRGGVTTRSGFSDTETESGSIDADEWAHERAVFTRAADLESVFHENPVVDHPPSSAEAIGPATDQLDGAYSIPFYQNSELRYVDDAGSTTTLSTGVVSVRTQNTMYATTSFGGSPVSVFFANSSKDTVYRVAPDETEPTAVFSAGNGVRSVLGTADIDGDDVEELVYVDGSVEIRYRKPNDSTEYKINGDIGSNNNTIGAGPPTEFPGYGVRIPVVDGNSRVTLLAGDGTQTILTGSAASKTALNGTDIDIDSDNEVIFVDSNGRLAFVDDVGGGETVKPLTDDQGSNVTGIDTERGVL